MNYFARLWLCQWTGQHQLRCRKILLCCSCTSSFCHFHPYHPCSVIFHLLGNPPTSQHHIKKVQKRILNYISISLLLIISNVMGSIIAVGMQSFLFSNHQFGFRPGHCTLDMLLQHNRQWMEALNARHEFRAISLDIQYLSLLIQFGNLSCSPYSLPLASKANSTNGFLTSSTLVTLTCGSQRNPLILLFYLS